MLEHAPHPPGQRYIAVTLHIAHGKGDDTIGVGRDFPE